MEVPIPAIVIPNEIVTKILSHLGTNDLLMCRLVSQSWNELSLKVLRNSIYVHYHELTQDNIEQFIDFSEESDKDKGQEWVLPFYLNFRFLGDTIEDDEESEDYHQIPKYIQKLQTLFGKKCVSILTLSHGSSSSMESVKELISILSLVAPSLIYLDLSEFKIRYEEEGVAMDVREMLGNTQLNFPNLSKLFSIPSPTYLEEDEEIQQNQENEIHSFLIEKSQNLTVLEVSSPSDLWVIQKQIGTLRTLTIVNELEDIDLYLESMKTCPFQPVLKKLSFTYCPVSVDHEILNELLSLSSTTLQILTVTFTFLRVPTNPFPRLSHLRFLRIHVTSPKQVRVRVDLEKLNLNSETFPVLESMEISTNVYFESTTNVNSGSSKDDDGILGTVKHLSIRVMDSPFAFDAYEILDQYENTKIISRASAKEYVDHLQELFPNVISLTLVNESDGHEEYLNQLLIEFIQSDGALKIRELEIQNCGKNYLGHILNGLDDTDHEPLVIIKNMNLDEEFIKRIKKSFQGYLGGSELKVDNQMETRDGVERRVITFKTPIIQFKMRGLEKICMSFNNDFGQSGIDHEHKSNQKDLFLMSLPKHLPLLRQIDIDISQQVFGHDKEFCKQQITNVQHKFPHLIINTTH